MLELARSSALALLLSAGAVLAQTSPSTKPITSTTATAASPTPSASSGTSTTATRKVNTGEIFRWVDSNGKVQYSADVPEDRKSTARKVDTRSNIVSSRVPASIASPTPAAEPETENDKTPVSQPKNERERCELAWKKYNESQACFAQYQRGAAGNRGNSVSPEAQEKCQSLAEPAPCR
jgi:Domain of unknown function (DUF4124)